MSAAELVITYLLILLIATVFSVVGQGGGIFYVPVLLAVGTAFNAVAAASLFVVMATGLSAAWLYRSYTVREGL